MTNPFKGLIAFPLSPLKQQRVDIDAFRALVTRTEGASVDGVCVLGSTGCYPYFSSDTCNILLSEARDIVTTKPLFCAVGGVSVEALRHSLDDAQTAGVDGVFLSPLSYQPLREEEVLSLYTLISQSLSVPLCVYVNAATTRFEFTDALLAEISRLPFVSSIKIVGMREGRLISTEAVSALRTALAPGVTIGVSGDHTAAHGLSAGCDAWYSVVAGLYPERAAALYVAANNRTFTELNEQYKPLWALFQQYGSLRVIATAAEIEERVSPDCLPLPLQSLQGEARQRVADALRCLP